MTNDLIEHDEPQRSDVQRTAAVPFPGWAPGEGEDREAWEGKLTAWWDWRLAMLTPELTYNRDGNLHGNEGNALSILTWHPAFYEMFERDDFKAVDTLLRPLPMWDEDEVAKFKPREVTEQDIFDITAWLHKQNMPGAKRGVVEAVVARMCWKARFDMLRAYLETCHEKWLADGVKRIDRWHTDYIISEFDGPYEDEVGPMALMALVARGLEPGCILRMTPIYQGEQGIGKSSALAALCPEESWFIDGLPDLKSKDTAMLLAGRWVVEAGELDVVKRADTNELKAFLTRRFDKFRPPYARKTIEQPRRCVFFGSTNDDDFLRDPTGAERFYPVSVTGVDIARIIADRDLLIGEAVDRYKKAVAAGEAWWELSAPARKRLEEVREENSYDDPLTGDVLDFVGGLDEVAIPMVMSSSYTGPDGKRRVGLNSAKGDRAVSHRVGEILKTHGWKREGQFTRSPSKGQKRWVRKAGPRVVLKVVA